MTQIPSHKKDKRVFQPKLLRAARERNGLSQAELAEIVNKTQNHISKIERGEMEPRSNLVAAFSEALNVSADYLLGLKPTPDTGYGENPVAFLGLSMDAYRAALIVNQLHPDDQASAVELTESLARNLALLRAKRDGEAGNSGRDDELKDHDVEDHLD